jgi:hypothetical protein
MGLRLSPEDASALEGLEPELRAAAEAIGLSLGTQLGRLRPGLSKGAAGAAPDVLLVSLTLGPEDRPDAVSLAAVAAAHRAYLRARGAPDGASLGALALARLLVWAQRAAMLGTTPRIAWIGPEPRRPEGVPGTAVTAACTAEVDGARRAARAVAIVTG